MHAFLNSEDHPSTSRWKQINDYLGVLECQFEAELTRPTLADSEPHPILVADISTTCLPFIRSLHGRNDCFSSLMVYRRSSCSFCVLMDGDVFAPFVHVLMDTKNVIQAYWSNLL